MREWFMVALGGMLGSLLRHAINVALSVGAGASFPWGTLVANSLGSFAIGAGYVIADRNGWLGGPWELAYRVGFLGGLTTFSSYSLEIAKYWNQGNVGGALAVLAANLVLGLLMVTAGMWVATVK